MTSSITIILRQSFIVPTPSLFSVSALSDLGRLERHLGREQVQSIVERSKALEQAEKANKRPKRAFEMSR